MIKCAICGCNITKKVISHKIPNGKRNRTLCGDCYDKYFNANLNEDELNQMFLDIIKLKSKSKKQTNTCKKRDTDNPQGRFITYIQETYDINSFNNYEYIKFAKIVNGTYKNMKEGISYEDLLLMFQKQYNNLNKIYMSNIAKGNKFTDGKSRFNYDLAIIINKYDSFKKWKQKQEILKAEIKEKQQQENEVKIDYKNIKTENNSKDEIDISDILDDIY